MLLTRAAASFLVVGTVLTLLVGSAAPDARAGAVEATAQASGFEQMGATASMSGVHKADVGFQRFVSRPEALRLRIEVAPDQPLNLRIRVECWRKNRNDYAYYAKHGFARSSGDLHLPIFIDRPQQCYVFAYAKYRNADSDDDVSFSLTLLAKQR